MTLRTRLALTIVAIALPLVAGLLWLRTNLIHAQVESAMQEFVLAHMDGAERELCEQSPETFGGVRGRRGPRHGAARGPGRGPGRGERPPGPPPEFAPDDPRPPPPEFEGPSPRPAPRDRRGEPRRDDRGGGRPSLFAYSSRFESFNPEAPPFPPALRSALVGGDEVASVLGKGADGRPTMFVAVRLPATGPRDTDSTDGAGGSVAASDPCAVILVSRPEPRSPFEFDMLAAGALAICATMLCAVLLAAGPIVRRIRRLTTGVRAAAADRYTTPVAVEGGDEIAALGRAFNEAGAELRAHIDTLGEREATLRAFLANTTHDVMIPLTVLQGHLAALRDGGAGGETVDTARLRGALEESHYIGSLLHNLAAAAKLDAGAAAFHTAPVDLSAVVERVAGRHMPIARQGGIELGYAVPPDPVRVSADVTLLEQAVSNLVLNAVRYNRRGGHVAITLESKAERFLLRVLDDGPGITPDELSRVTEPRFRSQAARTRDPAGQGLGLPIAQDVADRHGFELRIENAAPHGLEATLCGPLVPPGGAPDGDATD